VNLELGFPDISLKKPRGPSILLIRLNIQSANTATSRKIEENPCCCWRVGMH